MKKIDISKIIEPILKGMDKIGKLSKLYRILISLGVIVLFAGPLIYFSYLPKMQKIDELNKTVADLDQKLTQLKAKARQLKAVQKQFKAAENEFKVVMQALPEKKEIPNLLASISGSGMDAGLEFILFEPKGENSKDFYAEIPISIKVSGNYHNVAMFFDKVSRLSRIVNIDNISITGQKGAKGEDSLATSCTAITYRFVEKKSK
ncbi:MAG: type 4a pilus biogenesis protein PilO [Proteobacteria bacterium]|nr:type 4a pilus biogenesis protein PilO [Pseudomonadota bacterium]